MIPQWFPGGQVQPIDRCCRIFDQRPREEAPPGYRGSVADSQARSDRMNLNAAPHFTLGNPQRTE